MQELLHQAMGQSAQNPDLTDQQLATIYHRSLCVALTRLSLLTGMALGDTQRAMAVQPEASEWKTSLMELIVEGKGAERRIQLGFKGELAGLIKLVFNLEADKSLV